MKAVGLGLVALGALAMSSCMTTTPSTPRGSTERLSIAIPEFAPRTSGPDEIHFAQILPEIIRQDLRFSSLFTVVANEPPLPDAAAALQKRLADFAAAGAHGAMHGYLQVAGQRVTVDSAMMDYDGFNQEALTRLQSVSLWPVWSPREPVLAFTSFFRGYPYLWLAPFNPRQRKPELIWAWPGINSVAAWAADGQTVALTLSRDGNPEIYKARLGTSIFERLTHHDGIDTDATWAPSDREIAFSSDREGGAPRIWIMNDQGLNARRLTGGTFDTQPRWSPRGDTIVFTRQQAGRSDIWAISPDGSHERRLTSGPGSHASPAWAPNGRHLVFSSTRTGRPQLFTMLVDGSEPHGLLPTREAASSPTWSPRPQ